MSFGASSNTNGNIHHSSFGGIGMESLMQGAFSLKALELIQSSISKFASDGEISWITVLCIFVYLMKDGIKKMGEDTLLKINSCVQKIPDLIIVLFSWLWVIIHARFSKFSFTQVEEKQPPTEKKTESNPIEFKNTSLRFLIKNVSLNTIDCLVEYVKKTTQEAFQLGSVDENKYTEIVVDQMCTGPTTYITQKKYNIDKIMITPDVSCRVKTPFIVYYKEGINIDVTPIKLSLVSSDSKSFHNEVSSILETIGASSKVIEAFNNIYKEVLILAKACDVNDGFKASKTCPTSCEVVDLIVKTYPSIEQNKFGRAIVLVISGIMYTLCKKISFGDGKIKFSSCFEVVIKPEVKNVNVYTEPYYSYWDCIYEYIKYNETVKSEDMISRIKENLSDNHISDSSLEIVLESESVEVEKLYDVYTKFINDLVVEKSAKNRNEKVKAFTIAIEYETKIEMTDNPEYAKFIERRKIEQEREESTKNEEKEKNKENSNRPRGIDEDELNNRDYRVRGSRFSFPPQEKIRSEKQIPKIVVREICEFSKPLDTLYLSRENKMELEERLNTFKNYSSMYDRLAIPKKFNGILHGQPGLGKTSTLKAIATYLEYDIYYVSFNGIKKNKEMDMIFNHVYTQCARKGMVVFEDVDAHHIVHNRNVKETAISNSMSAVDDNLDLSYILNLLDGRSIDGQSVFLTTNHKELLDPAIFRDGRMDLNINMKKCDHYQIACIFSSVMCREISNEILMSIPEYIFSPAQVIFSILPYINKKKMSDDDIMKCFVGELKKRCDTWDAQIENIRKNVSETRSVSDSDIEII